MSNTIDSNTTCITCGYNLRGLSRQGNCPECGGTVAHSMLDSLAELDNDWLKAAKVGIWLLFAGVISRFVLTALTTAGGESNSLSVLYWLPMLVPEIMVFGGAILLLQPIATSRLIFHARNRWPMLTCWATGIACIFASMTWSLSIDSPIVLWFAPLGSLLVLMGHAYLLHVGTRNLARFHDPWLAKVMRLLAGLSLILITAEDLYKSIILALWQNLILDMWPYFLWHEMHQGVSSAPLPAVAWCLALVALALHRASKNGSAQKSTDSEAIAAWKRRIRDSLKFATVALALMALGYLGVTNDWGVYSALAAVAIIIGFPCFCIATWLTAESSPTLQLPTEQNRFYLSIGAVVLVPLSFAIMVPAMLSRDWVSITLVVPMPAFACGMMGWMLGLNLRHQAVFAGATNAANIVMVGLITTTIGWLLDELPYWVIFTGSTFMMDTAELLDDKLEPVSQWAITFGLAIVTIGAAMTWNAWRNLLPKSSPADDVRDDRSIHAGDGSSQP